MKFLLVKTAWYGIWCWISLSCFAWMMAVERVLSHRHCISGEIQLLQLLSPCTLIIVAAAALHPLLLITMTSAAIDVTFNTPKDMTDRLLDFWFNNCGVLSQLTLWPVLFSAINEQLQDWRPQMKEKNN